MDGDMINVGGICYEYLTKNRLSNFLSSKTKFDYE